MSPVPPRHGADRARTGSVLVAVGAAVVALAVVSLIGWMLLGPPPPGEELTWQTPTEGPASDGGGEPRALPVPSRSAEPPPEEPMPALSAPTTPAPSDPPPAEPEETAAPEVTSRTAGPPSENPTGEVPISARPASLRIPAAGIDEQLTHLGLASDGTINPPQGVTQYFTGHDRVEPGNAGTAVIAGHVSYSGVPDAFADLHRARVGDEVTVAYEDGTTRTFTVTRTFVADKDALTTDPTVWGAHPSGPRLAIITCDPALDYDENGHTLGNLVVVAE